MIKNDEITLKDIDNCESLTEYDEKIAKLYYIEHKSPKEIAEQFISEGSMMVASEERVNHYLQRITRKISHFKEKYDINDSETVYKQIAKEALMNWNGLSEEEATNEVREASNEELESQIYAQGSIDYALKGIQKWGNELGHKRLNNININVIGDSDIEDIKFAIMNSSVDSKIFWEFKEKKLWPGYDYEGDLRNDLTLTALSYIHDGWVKDNEKKFMSRDKKYQHMPIELIGWDEAKSDLLFLRPILKSMGINPSDKELEKAYDNRVKDFFREKGITDISQLQGEISKGAEFYPAWEGQNDILQEISNPQFISEELIPSIQENGIGADESAMSRIEQWKLRCSRLAMARERKKELQQESQAITKAEKLIEQKENNEPSIE